MSSLSVYHQSSPLLPNKVLNHDEDIASTLAAVGIEFRRLELDSQLRPGATADEVLAGIADQLETLKRQYDLSQVEVISLDRNPWREDERAAEPLQEQVLDGAQLYLFLAGQAQLNLHVGKQVYVLLGEHGSLLAVPSGVPYWLDVGEPARCVLVRLVGQSKAKVTGDEIASRFARLAD